MLCEGGATMLCEGGGVTMLCEDGPTVGGGGLSYGASEVN
jgi:hypothetical protein